MKVLVTRTDRLGDVMMALPSLDYLRRSLPAAKIAFACQAYFRSLVEPSLRAWNIDCVEANDMKGYSAVLFLDRVARLQAKAWAAGVPIRVGNLSKLSSFAFVNRGLLQHRSRAEKNEGRYSLELAEKLVREVTGESPPAGEPGVRLEGDVPSRDRAEALLAALGLRGEFAVLHPGTGGTAINLSAEKYAKIAEDLERIYGCPVVLTEGPSEEDRRLVAALQERKPRAVIREPDLAVVREVFRRAKVVVGPSTGVLHMAHYVGARTVGLYAPIRAQTIARWGFWGGAGRTHMLMPKVDCPGIKRCVGPKCPEFFCMDRFEWSDLKGEASSASPPTSGDA